MTELPVLCYIPTFFYWHPAEGPGNKTWERKWNIKGLSTSAQTLPLDISEFELCPWSSLCFPEASQAQWLMSSTYISSSPHSSRSPEPFLTSGNSVPLSVMCNLCPSHMAEMSEKHPCIVTNRSPRRSHEGNSTWRQGHYSCGPPPEKMWIPTESTSNSSILGAEMRPMLISDTIFLNSSPLFCKEFPLTRQFHEKASINQTLRKQPRAWARGLTRPSVTSLPSFVTLNKFA